MAISLIISILDRKTKQPCWIDLISVLGAVFGVAMIATSTDLNYTVEGTLFRATMCIWVVANVVRRILRAHK